ncbi:MAG: EpsG family protein [Lachnospiraceae bacterium]|nr:EpsG family protein [Lachnospiraceae bacterium]
MPLSRAFLALRLRMGFNMSNYYLIFVWIGIFAFAAWFIQMQRVEYVEGVKVLRMQPLPAAVLVFPLVLWTAVRGYVMDTGAYMQMFRDLPFGLAAIPEYMAGVDKDEGFYLVSAVLKALVTEDVRVYFFIVGAFQAFLLFRIYRKYSGRYVISFFLFIASTDYVSWMFNGMRQFVAVTITLAAFEFILDKKYIKAILIILFASLFHQSALIVIPFVFIVQGRAWNKRTLFFLALSFIAVVYVDQFTDILDTMLQETQYKNVVSDWNEWQDDGTNMLRVLVYSVPSILSLVGLRYIRAEDSRLINVCTNMSIISMGLYIISMFTSGIFIGRLPIYFSLYNYILLPWQIDHMFEEKSAKLVYGVMMAAYLGFYLIQVRMWGLV